MKAKISEIFDSIQGEGIYQGVSQLFLRFYGCNLNCSFCDTKLEFYREYDPGELLKKIGQFNGPFHSLSFTGGEPLLQADFLKKFLPLVKKKGNQIYLETNGTLPENLKELIEYLDIVAMDIKLPGSTKAMNYWPRHHEFLKLARKKDVFVKSVICNSTSIEELKTAIEILGGIDRNIPFVLQPNCYQLNQELMKKIDDFRRVAMKDLSCVRVIPQIHKLLGVK